VDNGPIHRLGQQAPGDTPAVLPGPSSRRLVRGIRSHAANDNRSSLTHRLKRIGLLLPVLVLTAWLLWGLLG
jgi:hypothetical protein